MTRDELIAAIRATADAPRKRGRPPADSVADLESGQRRIALEVHLTQRRMFADERNSNPAARARGLRAKAVAEVARRYNVNPASLARTVHRYRDLGGAADALVRLARAEDDADELRRRMRNFPDDVRHALRNVPAAAALALLRAERIDGFAPAWLLQAAADLMSAKLVDS